MSQEYIKLKSKKITRSMYIEVYGIVQKTRFIYYKNFNLINVGTKKPSTCLMIRRGFEKNFRDLKLNDSRKAQPAK